MDNGNVEILGCHVLKGALGGVSAYVFGQVKGFVRSLIGRHILLGKSGVDGHILRHVASVISSDVLLNSRILRNI